MVVPHPTDVGRALQLSYAILDIISRYQLGQPNHIKSHNQVGSSLKFVANIYDYVKAGLPVQMSLPAFPFKSPNTQSKVLGRLPDLGEQLALAHLNGLCAAISDVYPPGAELTIVSDGLVYNDLLSVPDKDVWAYGQALRLMAKEKGFNHIKFSRLGELLGTNSHDELDEIAYVANATECRRALLNIFSTPNFDPAFKISTDEDICLTYRGYLKFLETDLQHVYPIGAGRSRSKFKKGISYIAKQMLIRGNAFARAVRERFPNHIRLSIHQSTNETKLSIGLLPATSIWTTPWHCTVAVMLDGSFRTAPRGDFAKDCALELVVDDKTGNPVYFREKSNLFAWSPQAVFEPLYPCGLLIRPFEGTLSIKDVDASKLRQLAELNSPVVLRGFTQTDDEILFSQKAEEVGNPVIWRFGLILKVKDLGDKSRGTGNSLSAERMPFHYDGIFRIEKTKVDGIIENISVPPRFQFFTSVTPSPPNTGFTLFASSDLFFQHLPPHISIDDLRKLTWAITTPSFDRVALTDLPFVVDHPATGKPSLRYHEHWPQSKTSFDPMYVSIGKDGDATGRAVGEIIEGLLYDRRVTYWHSWHKGDVLLSDNISMMHTRTEFISGADRELWRIHID
ncbi:Pyoverdine/dityrosine biosynthesis protein-domain-containing protein [Ephemerocybe angulata]|uniref:Pyoverdine/dityrosine biosynthesis protein-domain-containing protein n=1 Tax=Ephemerocybe angulata TaxID=980116 RepID=A0A8H6HUU4_9AGAR|nr:Pyoverdine/dityrosine biosynthesis protein-domain-containing protein [Tulosesus angulatus]